MYILGLDVGTTGCKSVIFDVDGQIISSAYGEYKLYHRRPDWSELNPEEVWTTIISVIRSSIINGKIDPKHIAAVGTSVLGDAFIPVDRNGNPLYWSMTTFDARAVRQTRWLEENFGKDEVYAITGQPLTSLMPIYPLPKIQWLRENEEEIYRKTWMFLCWEDYLNLKFCGKTVTDYSVASRTMMFDIKKKKWSSEILEAAGLEESSLPEIRPSGYVVGEIDEGVAKKTGLSKETVIVTGGHDQPCGALGAGITATGPAMDATGTVECIGVVLKSMRLTRRMRQQGFAVHHYVIEDKFFMFGFNPTSGVILRWFRDNFADKEKEEAKRLGVDPYDILTSMASNAPIGSIDLFLFPYFEGSGTPTFNRNARGAFIGLTLAHSKKEVIRAILEGLCYELRSNVEAIESHGTPITELRTIGGGAKSPFWLQMKADVTKRNVIVPNVTEAAALGAAILASVGVKAYRSVEEAASKICKEKQSFSPKDDAEKLYETKYSTYKSLYRTIEKIFNQLSRLNA
ncbi:MAG: FGGY family carbohydrate kinase [Nitrososphaerota archaeon]|nr:FGGY family carbohydrate kinase [Candidatus Bathyarchaeota archaeon]MDW8048831.1 FGGY family carbohydrate kinase [Nitrososphaerota archaeon]